MSPTKMSRDARAAVIWATKPFGVMRESGVIRPGQHHSEQLTQAWYCAKLEISGLGWAYSYYTGSSAVFAALIL